MVPTARLTGNWAGPGSCTRSPATLPGRSRTTASPRKGGGGAGNSSRALPPLANPVPDPPRRLPRCLGDRQLRVRRPLEGLVVGIADTLLVFVGDHAVHASAQSPRRGGRGPSHLPRSGLVVCRACSTAWGCKSPTQPDGGEVLAKRKGVSARRRLKEAWSKTAT